MRKRIVISIVDGLHYRYLIDTGVVRALVNGQTEIRMLTTPVLKRKLEDSGLLTDAIKVDMMEDIVLSRFQRLHLFLTNNASKKLSETLNVKNELKKRERSASYFVAKLLRLCSGTWLYAGLLRLTGTSFRSRYYRSILKEFKPDLMVLSTPGQKINDLPLLYESRQLKIKTVSPVYSWDNLTAKGPFVFKVDQLIVWNDIMKQEAREYHEYSSGNVVVAGVPVFDAYVKVMEEDPACKENFRQQFGFDNDRPLLTITTIPTIYFGKCHVDLAEKIVDFISRGFIPGCNLLIRPHPLDETDYSSLEALPGVKVDYYGGSREDNVIFKWVPREDNTTHLARTMKYSDIVLNIASTITIDAACFDTPVINIAYDMKQDDREYFGSVARYYNYTHYKHVVSAGAATVVKNDDELLNAIQTYLQNPKHHSAERSRLVAQQTGRLDGLAYRRVADAILKSLGQ